MIFVDFPAVEECKNIGESYGEICVHCNQCGRFSKIGDVAGRCLLDGPCPNERDGMCISEEVCELRTGGVGDDQR
jgi:hypothetical protein